MGHCMSSTQQGVGEITIDQNPQESQQKPYDPKILEQHKPQDWKPYQGKFQEPRLPVIFNQKVNYQPTKEDHFLPTHEEQDGSLYNGQWNQGEANGFGAMLKPDRTYLKGMWIEGIFTEGGVLYPNGDFFIGNISTGERHFANGIIYKGPADYGIPHGQGEEIHPDGNKNPAFYQWGQKVKQD